MENGPWAVPSFITEMHSSQTAPFITLPLPAPFIPASTVHKTQNAGQLSSAPCSSSVLSLSSFSSPCFPTPCSFCFLCPQALCPERHMERKVSWETPGFTLKLGPHGPSGGDDLGGGQWQGSDCLACSSRALIQLRWGWEPGPWLPQGHGILEQGFSPHPGSFLLLVRGQESPGSSLWELLSPSRGSFRLSPEQAPVAQPWPCSLVVGRRVAVFCSFPNALFISCFFGIWSRVLFPLAPALKSHYLGHLSSRHIRGSLRQMSSSGRSASHP